MLCKLLDQWYVMSDDCCYDAVPVPQNACFFPTMTVATEDCTLQRREPVINVEKIDIVSTQSASDKLCCNDDYRQLLDACKRQSSIRLNAAAY